MTPPKRPGRPPLDPNDPTVNTHVRLPSKLYDEAYARAQKDRVTVPEAIRRALKDGFRHLK
jgi:hypothetical protein